MTDAIALAIRMVRVAAPLTTNGTRKSNGSTANGARKTRPARTWCPTGVVDVSEEGANSGNAETAAHTATVVMTYPSHPRVLAQAHANMADSKADVATRTIIQSRIIRQRQAEAPRSKLIRFGRCLARYHCARVDHWTVRIDCERIALHEVLDPRAISVKLQVEAVPRQRNLST